MANFYVDTIPIWKQNLLSILPYTISYPIARSLLLRLSQPIDERDAYLASMRLEVVYLGAQYLKRNFIHSGVEAIDPNETYVVTSLHFGQWGMYPASLYQQYAIGSQMIMTGRNNLPGTPFAHFWQKYGHARQTLSGFPGRLSTESFYAHARRLEAGISQIAIMDVREHGLHQKELRLDFMDGAFYLPRTVAVLARRAKVRILPYIGYYDSVLKKHRVFWFSPISADRSDSRTMQSVLDLLEPVFRERPEFYFNVMANHRAPF
ncbi:MAG: hypothetical protein P8171_08430 [Candidatus Thiodiazotropha sp.]